jgi:hypothetical protein
MLRGCGDAFFHRIGRRVIKLMTDPVKYGLVLFLNFPKVTNVMLSTCQVVNFRKLRGISSKLPVCEDRVSSRYRQIDYTFGEFLCLVLPGEWSVVKVIRGGIRKSVLSCTRSLYFGFFYLSGSMLRNRPVISPETGNILIKNCCFVSEEGGNLKVRLMN